MRKFSQLVKLRPESAPAKLMLASAQLFMQNKDETLEICGEILKMPNIDASIRSQTAMILAQAGKKDKAIEELRKVVKEYPKEGAAYEQIMMVLGNDMPEQKKLIDEYMKATGEGFLARLAALRYALMTRSTPLTDRYAESIINAPGVNSWQLGQVGRLFQAVKNYGYTVKVYEKLIEMEPQYVGSYLVVADIYKRTGKKEELAGVATRLAEQKVRDPGVLVTVAEIWMQAENLDEAIRALEEEVNMEPFKPEPYYNLAQLYIKADDKEKVQELLKKLEENCRPESKTFFTMGSICARPGRHRESKGKLPQGHRRRRAGPLPGAENPRVLPRQRIPGHRNDRPAHRQKLRGTTAGLPCW